MSTKKEKIKAIQDKINRYETKLDKLYDELEQLWDDRSRFFGNDGIDYNAMQLVAAL